MNHIDRTEMVIERIQYILSPVDGQIIKEPKIIDTVFTEKSFGQYVCIHPKSRKVLSPINGIIEKIEKYGRYIMIRSDIGTKIRIYIGEDTISIGEKYTKMFVSEGDRVNAGDVLLICDFEEIEKLGCEITIIITVIDQENILDIISLARESIKVNDKILAIIFYLNQ